MLETGQGLIIVGPPGCGKSHLVSAVAGSLKTALQVIGRKGRDTLYGDLTKLKLLLFAL